MRSLIKKLLLLLKLLPLVKRGKRWKLSWENHFSNIRQQRDALKLYSHFIGQGDLCFDIGANIGNRTELLLKLGAKIICIEPQNTCIQQLTNKYGANKNVIILAKAMSDRKGIAAIAICNDASELSTMSGKWKNEGRFANDFKWTSSQEVETTTLDALIEQYGLPVFCKIDVEGFEETVLRGLTVPIPFISFEFTKEFLLDANNCINYLAKLGKFEFNYSTGESMKFLFPVWVKSEKLILELANIGDKYLWGDIYARLI